MSTTELLQIVTGCVGSLGFALLFNVRGKRLWFAALGGLLSWTAFLLFIRLFPSEPIGYFLSATTVTLYAEIMARVMKTPTTTFIVVSLIPLIPGSSLYYTMSYALQSDSTRFISKAVYTLELAAALALGIIVATTAMNIVHRFSKNIKKLR